MNIHEAAIAYASIPVNPLSEQTWEHYNRQAGEAKKVFEHMSPDPEEKSINFRSLLVITAVELEVFLFKMMERHTQHKGELLLGIRGALGILITFMESFFNHQGGDGLVEGLYLLRQTIGRPLDLNVADELNLSADILDQATATLFPDRTGDES